MALLALALGAPWLGAPSTLSGPPRALLHSANDEAPPAEQAVILRDGGPSLGQWSKHPTGAAPLPFVFAQEGQRVRVTHIPKTAGASLQADLVASPFDFTPHKTSAQEMCFEAIREKNGFHVIFFREPREQIFSLYLECRFDVWGHAVTKRAARLLRKGEPALLADDCDPTNGTGTTWSRGAGDGAAEDTNAYHGALPSPPPKESASRMEDRRLALLSPEASRMEDKRAAQLSPEAQKFNWTEEARFVHAQGKDAFPRGDKNVSHDFVRWLDHFLSKEWAPDSYRKVRADPYNDYGCYNPWNMQTRAMVCSGRSELHHLHSLKGRNPPAKDVAIARVSAAEFVGISELYDESWCLLQFQLSGKLPSECTCDVGSPCTLGLTTQEGTRLADCKGHSTQKRHGVPPHGKASSLGDNVTAKLDRLSRADSELYLVAMTRVVMHLRAVETHTGIKLICAGRLLQLMETTTHIPGAQEMILNSTTLGLGMVSAGEAKEMRLRRALLYEYR